MGKFLVLHHGPSFITREIPQKTQRANGQTDGLSNCEVVFWHHFDFLWSCAEGTRRVFTTFFCKQLEPYAICCDAVFAKLREGCAACPSKGRIPFASGSVINWCTLVRHWLKTEKTMRAAGAKWKIGSLLVHCRRVALAFIFGSA